MKKRAIVRSVLEALPDRFEVEESREASPRFVPWASPCVRPGRGDEKQPEAIA
ncbi:MAG: hypothetical protein K6G83_11105 [Lachnospiraceae bacterium]|nr:hypothetical protein [Lachnospiraceae bacterium]